MKDQEDQESSQKSKKKNFQKSNFYFERFAKIAKKFGFENTFY